MTNEDFERLSHLVTSNTAAADSTALTAERDALAHEQRRLGAFARVLAALKRLG